MKRRDRIARLLGYVPARFMPQTCIAFKGEDRAHVAMLIGQWWLVGEVDCFKVGVGP